MSKHFITGQDIRIQYTPLSTSIVFEQNVRVRMRDGVMLSVNVFRPKASGRYPVVMAVSPYGKDQYRQNELFREVPSQHLGAINISDHTAFEAPDPNFWVSNGFIVIQGDVRGQGQSDGDTGPFHQTDHQDYYDLIEWAAVQDWSNGRIALNGVSYLCISQWGVAAMRPPHLCAVVLWEGWNDFYGRFYKGGIPETKFMPWLWNFWIEGNHNQASGFVEPDYLENAAAHPLRDAYWRDFETALEKIEVPALICASFSDQGLHTPDTFTGFERISSKDKWLISHRRPKWEAYYDAYGLDNQLRFLMYYLKDQGHGLSPDPRVRFEINYSRKKFESISRSVWPPEDTRYHRFELDATNRRLQEGSPAEGAAKFETNSDSGLYFDYMFSKHTAVVGYAALRLWISTQDSEDIDLFIGIDKIDRDGNRVLFYGFGGTNPNDIVSRGWLRCSHRELDESQSSLARPVLSHHKAELLFPGRIVSIDIPLCPSATFFEPGETLRVVVQGTPIQPDAPLLGYERRINHGLAIVHTGGRYDSHLLIPVIDA